MEQVHTVISMDHVIKEKKLTHFLFLSASVWSRDMTVLLDSVPFEMISSRNTFTVIPFGEEGWGRVIGRGWRFLIQLDKIRKC